MNYDLALKLKEAGFKSQKYCLDPFDNIVCDVELSELIEACGKGELHFDFTDGRDFVVLRRDKELKCFGRTPEEAVALLWLELNKK